MSNYKHGKIFDYQMEARCAYSESSGSLFLAIDSLYASKYLRYLPKDIALNIPYLLDLIYDIQES